MFEDARKLGKSSVIEMPLHLKIMYRILLSQLFIIGHQVILYTYNTSEPVIHYWSPSDIIYNTSEPVIHYWSPSDIIQCVFFH